MHKKESWFLAGLLFAILWASASTATKIALKEAQPLVVAVSRFGVASVIMLFTSHFILKNRLPRNEEWKQLAVYGLLNITIYLGLYVVAMKEVTAGIGALTVAASPVFISFLSFFVLNKPLSAIILTAIFICIAGFVVVAWPLFDGATVTVRGLALLILSMFSYSVGTIYFASKEWNDMHLLTLNGWQTLLGGIFMMPFVFFTYKSNANHFGGDFWIGTLWLAVLVSIGAVMLWLRLIKEDAVKAGLWLFLCPIFGIIIAAILVGDKISLYTILGVAMVLGGLGISHLDKKLNAPAKTD
ncbi:MAG TPA: EamA family transporter [Niabella sp.]|jgi:probable blue pigment (indigoidine) exporter|nr:DMT family transporter [Chitinophagaceae bacterium]HRO84257.1 EamA family transporter [Niabella sp.]